MRLAGHPEVYQALVSSEAPASVRQALDESRMEAFLDAYGLLRSKGYSDSAAQQTAMAAMNGAQPMPRSNLRFAGVYGSPS